MGTTARLNCWGMNNLDKISNAASMSTTRKYCLIHFLFKYTTKAMGKCVGNAHNTLKLLRQTVSTRIAQSVVISTPNKPTNKKKMQSNTLSVRSAHLLLLIDNKITITSNAEKNTVGVNHDEDCSTAGTGNTTCFSLTNEWLSATALSNPVIR